MTTKEGNLPQDGQAKGCRSVPETVMYNVEHDYKNVSATYTGVSLVGKKCTILLAAGVHADMGGLPECLGQNCAQFYQCTLGETEALAKLIEIGKGVETP